MSEIPPSIVSHLSGEQQYTLKLLLKTKDQELKTKDQELKTKDQVLKTKDQELEIQELKFEAEIKKMEDRLSAANYKVLLSQKLLTIRSFMRFIRDEFLFNVKGTFKDKLMVLANDNPELLEEWKIDKYFSIYLTLMNDLNQHAHPFFDTDEAFILVEGDLELEALQLIGFLWCVIPLPRKNLLIRNLNKDVIPLINFIKE
ncbi:uncharacterized protein LOC123011965 [Tribolium madens]|uniref:uncharacterized protein LOC123011965 n=1 Tax=Tribolium madens TaxID=41895 RepID=UPI001CF74EBB|nr:uncharacterized protein LOC123011965 [Tribolium madens]